MRYLKRNQCKGKPMVCPRKGSLPIKLSPFLLAAFIMLSMATMAIAQLTKPESPPPTLEERRLMDNYPYRDRIPDYYKELQSYERDGCKEYFYGEWQRDGRGDRVQIEYNKTNKAYEGRVTRSVSWAYNIGHLLFRVDFNNDINVGIPLPPGTGWRPIKKNTEWMKTDSKNALEGAQLPADLAAKYMDINWLRQQRECRIAWFKGLEYSFNQATKNAETKNMQLILNNNKLEYMIENKSWNFTRVKE